VVKPKPGHPWRRHLRHVQASDCYGWTPPEVKAVSLTSRAVRPRWLRSRTSSAVGPTTSPQPPRRILRIRAAIRRTECRPG